MNIKNRFKSPRLTRSPNVGAGTRESPLHRHLWQGVNLDSGLLVNRLGKLPVSARANGH